MKWDAPRRGGKTRREKARALCRSDFYFFVSKVLWPFNFGSIRLTQWHKERIREIEDSIMNGARRTLDLWFRGGFKSTFVSRYSTMWRFLRDPNITILIRHGDATKAEGILGAIVQHLLYNPVFRDVFPEFCPEQGKGRFGRADQFTLPNAKSYTAEPTVRARGIEANLTGDHYCHVHDDDVENEVNVTTPDTRFKLIRKWEDTPSILSKPPIYAGTHSMVGTPWHAAGLWLGHVVPKFGPDSTAPSDKKIVYRRYPACDSKFTPFAPEILSRDDLTGLYYEEGPYKFSANYLLSPTDPDTAIFKEEWIEYKPFPQEHGFYDKEWPGFCTVKRCMTVDLAESTARDADFLAYLIVDIDSAGRWFIRECFKRRMDVYAFITHMQDLHRKWDFNAIYVEATATQTYFWKWAQKASHESNLSMPLIPVKLMNLGRKSKEQRILACQPRWFRRDAKIVEGCPGSQDLVHDMINYPAIGHEDLLDAMAQLEVMEGKGITPEPEGPPIGSLAYYQDISNPLPVRNLGSWWDDPKKKQHILSIRRRYGKR